MTTNQRIARRLISILLGLAWAGSAVAQSSDASRGHELFLKDGCYLCHGTVGQGGVGPHIAIDLLPLSAFMNYVRGPSGEMPPFSPKSVSDADLQSIHAYLASLPKPPAVDSLPLLAPH